MTEDTDDILRDIRRWVKIIGIQEAKPALVESLSSDDEEEERDLRITYHLTDGEHSTRDISERISYSRYWISSRYDEWSNMGVIERDGSNSPYEHIISLEEAGIEIPEIPDPEEDFEDSGESSDGEETEEDESSESAEEDTAASAELTDY
ncbi:hypothetical protein [Halomicrococcus gelatinilyticus]|uniref:hypothetical protein n=1 Tax=Halomicrococcus gelatinilyticus TaxID=1702103 RepID=UPI002E0E6C31